jgi:hypothetical protein
MPNINLAILNQKATPAFFADTLANRPAPSFVGRIFISTDTLDLYRDTGTAWLLLSPSSTGTITGSGASGQVTYFSGTSSITGSNDLFWDSVNGHLGIGTITPSTALTIFHDQNQIIQLNQTTATNDTKIAFQNSGTPLWRIGNSYNAGANDYGIFDVVGAIQPLTIKKTTGQTFIGAQTTSSGRLVVNDATGDNHIVVIGATAPSLRINNSGSGATKQIGIGLATATNNFIQGAVDRDMAIFNGSTTPSPILFGIYGTTNIQEAARISAARNFLIGTTNDTGYKLNVNGAGYINNTLVLDGTSSGQYLNFYNSGVDKAHIYWDQSLNSLTLGTYVAGGSIYFETGINVDAMIVNSVGNILIGTSADTGQKLQVNGEAQFGGSTKKLTTYSDANYSGIFNGSNLGSNESIYMGDNRIFFVTQGSLKMTLNGSGNLLIGTTTDAGQKLQVNGAATFTSSVTAVTALLSTGTSTTSQLRIENNSFAAGQTMGIDFTVDSGAKQAYIRAVVQNGTTAATDLVFGTASGGNNAATALTIKSNKVINISSIPTSSAGLVSGDIYSNLGVLTIVP